MWGLKLAPCGLIRCMGIIYNCNCGHKTQPRTHTIICRTSQSILNCTFPTEFLTSMLCLIPTLKTNQTKVGNWWKFETFEQQVTKKIKLCVSIYLKCLACSRFPAICYDYSKCWQFVTEQPWALSPQLRHKIRHLSSIGCGADISTPAPVRHTRPPSA